MWWWYIYAKVYPLFTQCNNVYGLKVPTEYTIHFMHKLPDGTQKVTYTYVSIVTLTYCPTPMLIYWSLIAVFGILAFLIFMAFFIWKIGYPFVQQLINQHGSRRLQQPAELAFDEIMQQLNKTAEEYLKQAK